MSAALYCTKGHKMCHWDDGDEPTRAELAERIWFRAQWDQKKPRMNVHILCETCDEGPDLDRMERDHTPRQVVKTH